MNRNHAADATLHDAETYEGDCDIDYVAIATSMPEVMPEILVDYAAFDEHAPVICQLYAKKTLRKSKPADGPRGLLPRSLHHHYDMAVQEADVIKLGTLPSTDAIVEILDLARMLRDDPRWAIMRRMVVNEELSNYLCLYQNGVVSLSNPLFIVDVTSTGVSIMEAPEHDKNYGCSFHVTIDDEAKRMTLLCRIDRLRLKGATHRFKLLAAACFDCRLG